MRIEFVLLFSSVFLLSCKRSALSEQELQQQRVRSDSISIQLNSPELKAVNKELVNDPNEPELYKKRAGVYMQLKQFEEALGDAKLAIKLDSNNASYYMILVDAYFAMNNTRLAKENLLRMEQKFPDNNEVLLKLAELYYLVKQYQEAITYINKSLKIDESQAKAYHLKGTVYRESGDTAKAITSLQTAIEQDNRFLDAFYDLGVIYGAQKNPLAFDYYRNALKLDPGYIQARYGIAKLLQDLGKYDEAIQEYNTGIQQSKTCDPCFYNLGAIYLQIKKDYKQALDCFTHAIEVNPNYLEAYFARAFTYSLMLQTEAAKADYKMCLKLEPNYEAAIEGLNHLPKK